MCFVRLLTDKEGEEVFIRPPMVTMVTAGPRGSRIHLSCGCAVNAIERPEKVAADLAAMLNQAFEADAEAMYRIAQREEREPWQGESGEEADGP